MIGHRILIGGAATATLLGAMACQSARLTTTGPKQDVEFLRGCWISRYSPDGSKPQVSTVRLLPARDGSAALEGSLLHYHVDPANQEPPHHTSLVIARDGTTAKHGGTAGSMGGRGEETLVADPMHGFPAPDLRPGWLRASWISQQRIAWFVAEGNGEGLRLYRSLPITSEEGVGIIVIDFDGDRDGCD
jgi:hypothetical protein